MSSGTSSFWTWFNVSTPVNAHAPENAHVYIITLATLQPKFPSDSILSRQVILVLRLLVPLGLVPALLWLRCLSYAASSSPDLTALPFRYQIVYAASICGKPN